MENTVGEGKNASYQHFLLFPHFSHYTPTNEVGVGCIDFSQGHNFQSIETSNFKLHTQIDHIKDKCII